MESRGGGAGETGVAPGSSAPSSVAAALEVSQTRAEFFRHIRHDLRTPINHIIGYAELLLDEVADDNLVDFIPDLEKIHAAGQQLLTLVNESLDASRVEADDIDLDELSQALRTPLNAIIGYSDLLREEAEASDHDEFVPDLQKVHGAGTSLLALVNAALDLSKRSSDELGRPHLPASSSAPVVAAAPAPERRHRQRHPAQAGSLLIVDDNETNRDMLSRRLRRLGYTVSVAEDGEHALELLAMMKVDLVLLDIVMPGLSGFDVLERRKADPRLRDIPFIMISALDDVESVVRCIEMGAEDHLSKPFDPVLLRARIGACLEKKRLRDQEVEYLRQVAKVTAAAAAIEAGQFEPASLAEVERRTDALGQLARVFLSMAREVRAREERLKQQVQELRIEIDQSKKARQVAEITDTDYFQQLQQRAQSLRGQSKAEEP